MEQKDFFMREIEKISVVLRAILNSLSGNKENLAITLENQFIRTNEKLIYDLNFCLDKFIMMDETNSNEYLAQFKGINQENTELLAEIIFKIGLEENEERKKVLLRKSLQLYKMCYERDKTFSMERENRIQDIMSLLK